MPYDLIKYLLQQWNSCEKLFVFPNLVSKEHLDEFLCATRWMHSEYWAHYCSHKAEGKVRIIFSPQKRSTSLYFAFHDWDTIWAPARALWLLKSWTWWEPLQPLFRGLLWACCSFCGAFRALTPCKNLGDLERKNQLPVLCKWGFFRSDIK